MAQAQSGGVQMHPFPGKELASPGVNRIPLNRAAERSQMGPQLVRPPRERLQPQPLATGRHRCATPTRPTWTPLGMGPITRR